MPWYIGATTTVSFKWIGETLDVTDRIEIPQYSMLTDAEGKYVYTITEPVLINYTTKDQVATVEAIQGIYTDFKIAGNPRITTANIDANNRLYIQDYNIAQNGIYIKNIDDLTTQWEQVDNIQLYSSGSYVYEFNIDPSTNMCYIEFPKDYDELIGSGLNISYIITDGLDGNVSTKVIDTFYNDITITFRNEKLVLNEENIKFYNVEAAINGSNPATLTAAYNNYKKTVGTFNTLVTLRDYVNAIYNSGLVSNVQVSDRFHDIQTTYQVLTDKTGLTTLDTYFLPIGSNNNISFQKILHQGVPEWKANKYYLYNNETHAFTIQSSTEEPSDWSTNYINYYILVNEDVDLTAYDLRLYILKSSGSQLNLSAYNKGFELEKSDSTTTRKVKNYINNSQCVSHDFKDILPDIPCMFRNIFPLNIKIIPQYQLNETQKVDLQLKIFDTLLHTLQSRNMTFGEEPDYEFIYNTILESDSRIKTIILDDFAYTTYAVYWDAANSEFKYVPISDFNDANIIVRDTKDELDTLVANDTNIVDDINNTIIEPKYKYLYIAKYGDVSEVTSTTPITYTCYIYDDEDKDDKNGELKLYSDKIISFREDIIAKNVLAGNTALFKQDTQFKYNILQDVKQIQQDVDKLTTELTIAPMGGTLNANTSTANINNGTTNTGITANNSNYPGDDYSQGSYVLGKNESIQLYGPSFRSLITYSNYVKFLLVLDRPTGFSYEAIPASNVNASNISYSNPIYIYELTNDIYVRYTSNAIVEYTKADGTIGHGNLKDAATQGLITIYRQVESRDIPLNTEYELRDGDKLYIFYRDQDENNAPYRYRVYEQGKIVKPNFTIIANAFSDTLNDNITVKSLTDNIIGTSGNIEYSADPRSPFGIINNFYGERNLSGSKTIELREINQVSFEKNSGRRYYWVTNNIENEQYKLTLYQTEANSLTYEYILKNNEYFIHVDPSFSTYEVLGAGTLIRLETASNSDEEKTYYVDVVENYVIETQGLPAFQEKCITISNGTLTVREQQIFNLVESNRLILTLGSDYYTSLPQTDTLKSGETPGIPKTTTKNIMSEQVNVNSIKCFGKESEISDSQELLFNIELNANNEYVITPNVIFKRFTNYIPPTNGLKYSLTMSPVYVVNYEPNVYYTASGSDEQYPDFTLCTDALYDDFKSYYYVPCKNGDRNTQPDFNLYYYFTKVGNTFKNITEIPTSGDFLYVKRDEVKQVFNYEHNLFFNKNGETDIEYKVIDDKNDIQPIPENDPEDKDNYPILPVYYRLDKIEETASGSDYYYLNSFYPDIIDISYNKYDSTSTPVLTTDKALTLKGIDIAYSEEPEDYATITSLPSINLVNNDGNWKATATLNLNSGPANPQVIITETENSKHDIVSTQLYKVNNLALNTNNEIVNICSNVDMQLPGGLDVDVSYLDVFGNSYTINILPYISDGNMITADGDGNIIINIANTLGEGTSQTVNLNQSGIILSKSYNYILPIKNTSSDVTYNLYYDENINNQYELDTALSSYKFVSDSGERIYYGEGTQYYLFRIKPKLNVTDISEKVKFKISINKVNSASTINPSESIIIYPLVRYVDTSIFNNYGINVNSIINKIKSLDKDSIFKWDYIIPQGNLIKDPLNAKSFFNENHTCNKFTLGEADLDFTSVGSQFDIIGNR